MGGFRPRGDMREAAPSPPDRLVLGYEATEQRGIGMPIRHHPGFYYCQHPIGRRSWHAPYAVSSEHLHGCFEVNPEIALVRQHQASIQQGFDDTGTRMVDGGYCILASGDIAGASGDRDILLVHCIAISLQR